MTTNLGSKRKGNWFAKIDNDLRRLIEKMERVPSRTSRMPAVYPCWTEKFYQFGHGFTVGSVIARNADVWGLASDIDSTPTNFTIDYNIALVTRVIDPNTFIVTWSGYAKLRPAPASTYALYILGNSPGSVRASNPTDFNDNTHFVRGVYYHTHRGNVYVLGPEQRRTHTHRLSDLRDFDGLITPLDGWVLQYNATLGQFQPVASSTFITGIGGPFIPAPTPATDKDFLRYDGGSSSWKAYGMGDVAYDSVNNRIQLNLTNLNLIGVATKIQINVGCDIRWIVRGTEAGGDDKWASVVSPSTDLVQLKDDATAIAEWHTNATAANRKWSWKLDVEMVGQNFTVDGTSKLRFAYDATPHYATIAGDASSHLLFSDNGTEVMRWVCDPSVAANRQLRVYMPLVLSDNGGNDWKLTADGLGRLHYNYSGADWFVFDGNGGGGSVVTARYYVDVTVDSGKAFRLRNGAGAYITDNGTTNAQLWGNLAVKANSPANGDIAADGVITAGTAFLCGTLGLTGTVTLKALTTANGFLTFQGGIITGYAAPT